MSYEQKKGTGTLWKNEKYTQGGNQPYAKGKVIDLNGDEIEITLWIPKSEKIKGFNVTITEPYNRREQEANVRHIVDKVLAPNNDDLPF